MATVRPTSWPLKNGKTGRGWKLSYFDAAGKRHRENFATKAAADRKRVKVEAALANGIHVPQAGSLTLIQALQDWLDHMEAKVKAGKRAEITWDKYDQHVRLHVSPHDIANIKLCNLRTPDCQSFIDAIDLTLSHAMVVKVRGTVRTGLGFAARKGWIVGNPMDETELDDVDREDGEVVIPDKADVAAILAKAQEIAATDQGRAVTIVTTGFFSGARPSELLALERPALTIVGKDTGIRISQALDKRGKIQLPKRAASHRTVPIGPHLVNVLKRWVSGALAGLPHGEQIEKDGTTRKLQMLFPNEAGRPYAYHNFYHRIWGPLLIAAGIVNEAGEPKYPPNVMRHFAASLWIEQGVNMKRLQKRMGHASIQTTMNIYGHLFRNADRDQEEAAAAETAVLSLTRKDESL